MRPAETSQPWRPGPDPLEGRPGTLHGQPCLPSPELTAKAVVQVIAADGPQRSPRPALAPLPAKPYTAVTVYLLAGSAILVLLLFLSGLYRAHDQAMSGEVDSDRMLCFALCRDILGSGYPLTSWHLPGPPYLFPDVALLLPCTLVSSDLTVGFLLYSLLFDAAVLIGLFWIHRLVGLRPLEAWLLACAGMVLVAVAGLPPPRGDRMLDWFDLMCFYPGQHSGAILAGLWLTALVLRSLRHSWGPVSGGVFVVLGGLGAFSDKLLIVQFLAPVALALILLALSGVTDRKRTSVNLSLILIAGAFLLSIGINQWFQALGFVMLNVEPAFHFSVLWSNFKTFLHHLPRSIWAKPVFLVAGPLFVLTGIAVLAGWARSVAGKEEPATGSRDNSEAGTASATADDCPASPRPWQRPVVLALVLIGLLSPLCNLATVLVTGMWTGDGAARYLLALVYLPCLLPGLLLRLTPWKSTRFAALALPVVIAAVAVYQLYPQARVFHWADLHQPYPALAQAVDQLARERGFKRGFAGFWSARYLTFLSKEQVVVNSTTHDCMPNLHANNSATYLSPDARDLTVPEFHFFIVSHDVNPPRPRQIVQQYGEPDEKKIVGDHEVWIYNRMRNPNLDRFLGGLLAVKYRQQGRFITPVSPAPLAHPKANFSCWWVEGSVQLQRSQKLEARFARPVSGRLLDIAAHSSAAYELTFYRAEAQVGKLAVPAVPWAEDSYNQACLFSRLLPLPGELRRQPWDRVLIRPVSGPGPFFTVGHVLVYE